LNSAFHFWAASFDWEQLLPLLFFVAYGVIQFLGHKKKPADPLADDESADDPDVVARQIREEIQRKIEERRRAAGDTQAPGPVLQPRSGPEPSMMSPTARQAQAERPMRVAPAAPVVDPQLSLMHRLEKQRARLAEAEEQQRAAARRAQQMVSAYRLDSEIADEAAAIITGNVASDVRELLQRHASQRTAIVLAEILGPPVGLRPAGATWER
jgi:hypothetical protein